MNRQPQFDLLFPTEGEATDDRTARPASASGPAYRPDSDAASNLPSGAPSGRGERLVLIDSHNLIYQVFHALPPMTSPDGVSVGAVHGFLRDLAELLEHWAPTRLACTFDGHRDTFRHQLYPAYKAGREEMPVELRGQIALIRETLGQLEIPQLDAEGFEADDLMATLATQAAQAGAEVLLVTGDKDCRQLLSDRISILNLRQGKLFGPAELLDVWGVRPEQVVDFQSLVGDTSDNVPGVPLIGPKIASQLLAKHASLDAILEHPEQAGGQKRQENLKKYRDQALLSRELVMLRRDVPLPLQWWQLTIPRWSTRQLRHVLARFGFRQLLARFERLADPHDLSDGRADSEQAFALPPNSPGQPLLASPAGGGAAPDDAAAQLPSGSDAAMLPYDPIDRGAYQLITSEEQLSAVVEQLGRAEWLSVDTETTSLRPREAQLVGLALSWAAGQAAYIPLLGPLGATILPAETTLQRLKPLLEDAAVPKVGQNLKYDLVVLRTAGITLGGIAFDTMVADYLLEAGARNHSLDELALRYLDHTTLKIDALIGRGTPYNRMDQVPLDQIAPYAAEDADIPWRLRSLLAPRLAGHDLRELFEQVEMPLVEVLADMEYAGICVDADRLRSLSGSFDERLQRWRAEILELAGRHFNPDSPKQLASILFDELGLPVIKRTKTGPSTDAEVLAELAAIHPLPARLIEYRQATKLKNTYLDALPELIHPETGRIHTSFRQDVAATGRLSSSEPNLQNIPVRTDEGRQIRSAFRAGPDGWQLLTADYSQIELRVLAHYSQDPVLIEAFEHDQDIHASVAAQVHGIPLEEVTSSLRRAAKAINFGIIYGQSPFGLAKSLHIDRQQAADFIEAYFERFSAVRRFLADTIDRCRQQGHITTLLGRRRRLQGLRDFSKLKESQQRNLIEPERMAINTLIQGSAADLIKLAMLNVHRLLKPDPSGAQLLLQIHDELILEAPAGEIERLGRRVRQAMQSVAELTVPLKVDLSYGDNWGQTRPLLAFD
jgi:DNA polymerase I